MEKIYNIAKLSPCISTMNLGDHIIEDYCDKAFDEIFGEHFSVSIPTRDRLSRHTARKIASADFAFICGTNLLSSDMKKNKQWNITLRDSYMIKYSDIRKAELFGMKLDVMKKKVSSVHMILMGTGWFDYQQKASAYTQKMLHTLLDGEYIHSVRDAYTEKQLKSIGINNVLNTSCPTMWGLDDEFCSCIPSSKKENVIATITDYRPDRKNDRLMFEILSDSYKKVYVWLQSPEDERCLGEMGLYDKVDIIPPSLRSFDNALESIDADYVGTRLHGGIRALNHKKRSCIIAVDNRAVEISRDTCLPIIKRENIEKELPSWIDSDTETRIRLPKENILKWKAQFTRED